MGWIKFRTALKKAWLWSKKFWWIIVIGLLFVCTGLIAALTRNNAFLVGVIDLLEDKRESHNKEMETLTRIHNTEITEKNARLEEHLKRKAQIQEEFAKRGETLDKRKEAELKRLVDESYNDPEKLAKELAKAFGL
jgi:LPS O-antigen subunit length determinant protein (WzzB/FepE family)